MNLNLQARRGAGSVLLVGLVAVSLFGNGCQSSPARTGRPLVVTTIYPVEFIAEQLDGDSLKVINLTPPGAEPHDLELKPSYIRMIHNAQVVFYLGKGFQPTIEKALGSFKGGPRRVDLLDGELLEQGADRERQFDPHLWLSITRFRKWINLMGSILTGEPFASSADVENKQAALLTKVDVLGSEFRNTLANCKRKEIFTSHAAFAYLAADFGLKQVALTGIDPEAEPSPQRLLEITAQARDSGATTIFFESLVSPRVADSVARSLGAKTAALNPIEGLTRDERKVGKDYFSLMRSDLAALAEALGCG